MLTNYARLLELKIFEQLNTQYTVEDLFKNKKNQDTNNPYYNVWQKIYAHIIKAYGGSVIRHTGGIRLTLVKGDDSQVAWGKYSGFKYGYIYWEIDLKTNRCIYTILSESDYKNKMPRLGSQFNIDI